MWSAIKTILNDRTSKCLIIEDGQPKYVLLTFEEYQQLQKQEKSDIIIENSQEDDKEDKINGEIQQLQTEELDESLPQAAGISAVKIEDLPF